MRLLITAFQLLFLSLLSCDVFAGGNTKTGDDYYEILGVQKDADDRTIRKAFKKLAILKHPDKNKDDEGAHAEFLKINRAYEVLKDEELRKKYDQYGEAGLADDFNPNQNFQSWQFYKDNFGIYDDDVEITTLNRADFDRLVTDSQEIWFINFYSTYCSHCHQLAPAWRKFASEMDGVIRVGAVNCAEDPGLCQSQNVMGYPSLVWYPERIFYQGPREVELLVDFVMSRLPQLVVSVTSDLVTSHQESDLTVSLPWIIDFCDDSDRCLTDMNRRKLAVMLRGLVNVGTVDCHHGPHKDPLCDTLDRTDGVLWFEAGKIEAGAEKVLESLDPKELSDIALKSVQGLEPFEVDDVKGLFDEHIGAVVDTAIWFIPNENALTENLEILRLRTAVPGLRVGFFDCSQSPSVCGPYLDVSKLPTTVVFKESGGYEINYVYSKQGWRDQLAFIRESVRSPIRAITPEIHEIALESGDLWLIDYFAPWCPPCIRLMSELRRLHTVLESDSVNVNIGTIDCTKYNSVCQKAGVSSYPHKKVYYKGKTFSSVGYSSVDEIVDFLDDALNPSVTVLTPEVFTESIENRGDGVTWVVDFFAPWCGPCQQLAPEFQRAARSMRDHDSENVHYGSLDCQEHRTFCEKMRVTSYPSIRLYPARGEKVKRKFGNHIDYPGNVWRNADSIHRWTFGFLPTLVTQMGNEFFSEVLDSSEPWLVDFYAPWCGPCMRFAPVFDQIAKALEGRVNLAKVDCDQWPGVCQSIGLRAYPTVRLYKGSTGSRQDVWGIEVQSQEKQAIIQVVDTYIAPAIVKDEL